MIARIKVDEVTTRQSPRLAFATVAYVACTTRQDFYATMISPSIIAIP